MLTSVLSLDACENDSPWRRLYWTLPAALSIWIAVLWVSAYFMGNPSERLPEPPAVEAQLIEFPLPTINTPSKEKKPAAPPVKPAAPREPRTTSLSATPQARIERNPSPVLEEKATVEPSSAAAPTLPKAPSPSAPKEQSATSANLPGTSGAQPIVQPLPQIPEDLRQDALSTLAVARFRVAADGTATVELIKPTPNPRLNRLLLDTLKNWRFFPAMKDGKPVASTKEIVIKVDVN